MSSGRPVMVAMSGGVDSSVAAALLARSGRRVVGVSLRLHDASEQGGAGRCCSPEDFRDARLVAGRFGFPYYVLDTEDAFRKTVLSRFVDEYRAGRTPSPCVSCNTDLKFGALARHADQLGAGSIATGHYARLGRAAEGTVTLRRAADADKDQSYFLFDLDQDQLARAEFPLGDLTKGEVRKIARDLGLAVADKPESQDICFVPGGDYRAVLRRVADLGPAGEIVDSDGRTLGRHDGIAGYTVGQRRGLGASASGDRLYVLGLDGDTGRVTVGPERRLLAPGLVASRWRWLSGVAPDGPVRGTARIRYRHAGADAVVTPAAGDEGRAAGARVTLRFDQAQRAVTPGQAVVLYRDDEVLGGGWIDGPLETAAPADAARPAVS